MKEIVIKVKDDIYEKARNEYYGENEVSASMVNEIFSAVFHGIPSVNPQKWIPVERELPKDEQEVLITYKINVKHHVWSAIWDKLHGRFYDKEYRSYISLNYVTAWMPLPSPFEPQESEEY